MLYTEQDYIEIQNIKKKFWIKIFIVTLAYIAVVVACSILRLSWPGYAAGALWGIIVVFFWGMQGARIRRYFLFLRDIKEGLDKTITGSIVSIDRSVTSHDLVEFYTVIFNDDEANPESPSRKLYFDASKNLPDFQPGERLQIALFGNNIKGFQKI